MAEEFVKQAPDRFRSRFNVRATVSEREEDSRCLFRPRLNARQVGWARGREEDRRQVVEMLKGVSSTHAAVHNRLV